MSRCFPFPPPGYEARPNDVNLIIKEKQKKHKDKKDKDKKERNEKKEKERSEGRHKDDEKRKRKKHKDKKDKNKDKRSPLEEGKNIRSSENQNGGKLVPESKPTDGIHDKSTFVIVGRRVSNDGGAMDNQMVQKITFVKKRKANLLGNLQETRNGMLAEPYRDIKDKRVHSRMANGQTLKVDARSLRNGLVGNYYGVNQIKVEGGLYQVDEFEKNNESKEKNGDSYIAGKADGCKNADASKITKDKIRKEEKKEKVTGGGKEKIQLGTVNGNFLDFHANKPSGLLNQSHDCHGKLIKHKELNGCLHGNGIQPHNMSRPTLLSHQAGQNGSGFHSSQNVVKLAAEKGTVVTNQKVNGKLSSPEPVINNFRNMICSHSANNSAAEHGAVSINNHVLRNGLIFSHLTCIDRNTEPCQITNDIANAKQVLNNHSADEKIPSPHPHSKNGGKIAMQGLLDICKMDNKEFMMNGRGLSNGVISSQIGYIERKMEPCQTTNGVAKVKLIVNNRSVDEKIMSPYPLLENGGKIAIQDLDAVLKMDNKEFCMNGSLEGKKQTSSTSTKAKQKPPHPDLKYLSQILTIPEVEWPKYDDQEWLFGCKESQTKKPKLALSQIQQTKQVWSEAMQVESADAVCNSLLDGIFVRESICMSWFDDIFSTQVLVE